MDVGKIEVERQQNAALFPANTGKRGIRSTPEVFIQHGMRVMSG